MMKPMLTTQKQTPIKNHKFNSLILELKKKKFVTQKSLKNEHQQSSSEN